MTNPIGDDLPGAFSPHPDLPPLTVAQLEWYHQRYLERGDTATALVLTRLAASGAASKLWKEMRRRRGGEYVHPAGLVSVWSDPDLRPGLQKLHRDYLTRHPNGVKWRDVRKWLESASRPTNERSERDLVVAEMLAMLAGRVTRSDAGNLAEMTRQLRNANDAAGLLGWLIKGRHPDHAAVFTQVAQDPEHNLKGEWTRVENELILALYGTLSWPMGSLGYRIVAGLVGAALDREIDWQRARYVIDRAKAAAFLREQLAAGPVSTVEIERRAKGAGITKTVLRKGPNALGIKPQKIGNAWFWALPAES
jgi:hypothetical protein